MTKPNIQLNLDLTLTEVWFLEGHADCMDQNLEEYLAQVIKNHLEMLKLQFPEQWEEMK